MDRQRLGRMVAEMADLDAVFASKIVHDIDGRLVMVPLLPSDSMHLAVNLVSQGGGKGTVVVPVEGGLCLLTMETDAIHDRHDDCSPPVGPECTVEDFMKVLMPGVEITFRVEHGSLRIDESERVPVDLVDV